MLKGIFRDKKAIAKSSFAVLGVLVLVFSIVMIASVVPGATITTDKEDYAPEETVLISGSGFLDSTPINIKVTRPDSTVHTCPDSLWCPNPLPTTSTFSNYPYKLNGITGTYIIDASDGTNSVQKTFTDKKSNGEHCNSGNECHSEYCDVSGHCADCIAETNTAFCSRLGKTCGSVTALDNCGTSRTVNPCGTCTAGQTCISGVCTTSCTPTTEVCDGIDNDCDQSIDETFSNKGQSCSVGQGICQRTGTYVCKGDKTATECSVTPGNPSIEVCANGLDDDCDSSVDEGCEGYCTNNAQCNDGNACTNDVCNQNQCEHPAITCVDDGNPCTSELCDPTGGCIHPPLQSGTSCSNGLFCDGAETCNGAGVCSLGTTVVCNDQNPCTTDSCSNGQSSCIYTLSDTTGPVVSNPFVIPNLTSAFANVGAHAEDACSNIASAKYYVDNACLSGREVLNADDGTFNEKIEDLIKYDADFRLYADGRHDIYINAWDSAGNPSNCVHVILDIDKVAPDNPRCSQGSSFGMELDGQCNTNELLVCGNNPLLTAYICDAQSKLRAAEFFIDNFEQPNWQGISMQATDGLFDEQCEDVQAQVGMSQLSEGTHYIKLHGKDTAENWGKLTGFNAVSFIKDTTAPKTEKTINFAGGAHVDCSIQSANGNTLTDGCYYVKQGTTIKLIANDFNPNKLEVNNGYNKLLGEYAGNVVINWKVWYSNENDCSTATNWVLQSSGSSGVNQDVDLTLNQDSCHLIEYWAVDGICGNAETHHFELDIVDTQAPLLTKTVGEPKITGPTGYDWYVTQNTEICLSATDPQPHPVEGVSISCNVKQWNTDPLLVTPDKQYLVELTNGCFHYTEDSYHTLTCTATDALGNSVTLTEKDIVDTQKPVTTKVIGDPKYIYEGKVYIDGITTLSLTCVDPTPHPVGGTKIYYRYRVGTNSFLEQWTLYTVPFGLPEGRNEVEYYCNDSLGNTEAHQLETDYVDHTPPVTTKTYGTPLVETLTVGYPKWIKSTTLITLTATDGTSEYSSGVAQTKYRVTLLGNDEACNNQELCQSPNTVGSGNWVNYSNPFTIPQDSCHLIEYYSVDNVNKTEVTKKQCVFVDNTAPTSSKLVGEPKVPCLDGTVKCGPQGAFSPFYVTNNTPIEFTCTDQLPHPVDKEKFCFKVSQEISLVGKYCEFYHGTLTEDQSYCCVPAETKFTFKFLEESLHKIEWYCKDELENKEIVKIEYDNVDNTPPTIIVWNPTSLEARNVERCSQSIVVQVFDTKSGVKEGTIYAELYYTDEQGVATTPASPKVNLKKTLYGTYEGLMDKDLPVGNYILKVFAKDNLGNERVVEIQEHLAETVFVEYISPATCNIDPEEEGNCNFTLHVCMRGGNSIQFWMNKLGGIIPPGEMNAMISDTENPTNEAFVGLAQTGLTKEVCQMIPTNYWDDKESICRTDAGLLQLGCGEINGKEQFTLKLDVPVDVASQIGLGNHDLEYWIKSSLQGQCICGNSIIEPGEQCDDGNLINYDGCSSLCKEEYSFENVGGEGVDADGDGDFEANLEAWHGVGGTMHQSVDLHGDTFIEMDGALGGNPTKDVWSQINAYSTAQWWTPNAAGDGFGGTGSGCYSTLSNIKNMVAPCNSNVRYEPTDHVKLIKLEIGGSSSWNNEIAYVDNVVLNGNVIINEP